MDWENMSNSEIESKLKSMEFEYESEKKLINDMIKKLDIMNEDYINGKYLLEKRSGMKNF